MAYIGVSPSNGVRQKHTYTATANQTSFSGAGAEGISLSYLDSNYVDVYQNGVKLSEADYTSTTGTTVVLAQGASVSDMIEIIVYDVFSVADTVSKADGGTFDGNVTMAGTLGVTGVLTGTSLDISGDIDVDGTTNLDVVDIDSTLNVQGETTLQTHLNMGDNDIIKLGDSDDLQIYHDGSNSYITDVGTGNLLIQGNGTAVVIEDTSGNNNVVAYPNGATTLSYQGTAKLTTTSTGIQVTGNIANTSGDMTLDVGGDLTLDADGGEIYLKNGGTHWGTLLTNGTPQHFYIDSKISDGDIIFRGNDGGSTITALTLNMSEAGTAVFNKDINVTDGSISSGVTHTFNLFGATGTGGNANYVTYSFVGDPNTGMFSGTADTLKFATGGSERLRIHNNGLISVGNTSADAMINITNNYPYTAVRTNSDSTNGHFAIEFHNPNGRVGNITTTGSSTAYNTSSDHRLKESVTYDFDATTRLKQLKPCRFNFIADADTTVDGFLAHEVQSVVPEAITGTHNEVDDDGNPVYQGIDQSKLVPLLVKTIQELEARIEALENA